MKYAIYVVTLPDYPHTRAFDEVRDALHYGLLELGLDSVITGDLNLADRQYIVYGSNLIPHLPGFQLPPGTILYNLEQVSETSEWFNPLLIELHRNNPIWDYSEANIARWQTFGVHQVTHVPIGYVPQLSRIEPAEEDIDVLFYGSFNDRRNAVLNALRARGVRVESVFGVYGAERDALIARSKLVINIHYYDAKIFEVARIFYLLANNRFVLTETSEPSADQTYFEPGLAIIPYENLVDACCYYLEHPEERQAIAQQGFELVKNRKQSDALRFLAPQAC